MKVVSPVPGWTTNDPSVLRHVGPVGQPGGGGRAEAEVEDLMDQEVGTAFFHREDRYW